MSNKICLLGDLHWGVRNGSPYFLDMMDRYFNEFFFPELERRGISIVIQLGDMFDRRKGIDFFTLNCVRRKFIERAHLHGIAIITLLGNHDVFYRDSNEISAQRELLSHYDHVTIVETCKTITLKGENFGLVPWINKNNYNEFEHFAETTNAKYLIGHFELAGFAMYKGIESQHGMGTELLKRFYRVYSGHYHTGSDAGNVFYTGIPYQLTWSDYDDPKGFYVLDTATGEHEFVETPDEFLIYTKIPYTEETEAELMAVESDFFASYKNKIVKLVMYKSPASQTEFDRFVGLLLDSGALDVTVTEVFRNQVESDDESETVSGDIQTLDTFTFLRGFVQEIEQSEEESALMTSFVDEIYKDAMAMMADTD